MHFVELWSLREDTLIEFNEGEAVITTRWGEVRFCEPGPALRTTLERMSFGPISLRNADYDSTDLDPLQHVIVRSLATADGIPLLSATPISSKASFSPVPLDPGATLRLSRFAQIRMVGDRLRVESALSAYRVDLHTTEAFLLVSCFGSVSSPEDASARLGLSKELTRAAAEYLIAAGMVISGVPGEGFAEDRDSALVTWSPHALMMHSRSRLGRHDDPFGATFPHAGRLDPDPPVKEPSGRLVIRLPRPDLERLLDRDPPVTAVLEARRSVREFGDRQLTLSQIGELLYRTARVRSLTKAASSDPIPVPRSSRPYPSTGGAYALELYLAVSDCAGLQRDVYFYDPLSHALYTTGASEEALGELLDDARVSAGLPAEPPVLIVITARFRRMNWQYEGLAYSALLKDVGVLMQTLYLVCTAMRLGCCALAAGDGDLSARALGTDWRLESSIGEFVLGSLPTGVTPDDDLLLSVNDHDWRQSCAEEIRRRTTAHRGRS
ncbi:SagB family peptide dehydrogenase [Microbispora sp. NPDC049125]|uniref:SagB/ThcOx family dehydrogenase n=1 Tax=Microbispora sp. NPDC049125 TaxID=3154929 RepID=UPI003465D592